MVGRGNKHTEHMFTSKINSLKSIIESINRCYTPNTVFLERAEFLKLSQFIEPFEF